MHGTYLKIDRLMLNIKEIGLYSSQNRYSNAQHKRDTVMLKTKQIQ